MTTPHFYDYLPFEEGLVLYLNNSESHLPKDDLYQEGLKNWRIGSGGEDFLSI
jgi:hypothetical protein